MEMITESCKTNSKELLSIGNSPPTTHRSHMRIKIASEFSTAPGPRNISEGKFSGEQFRKELLLPKVREACDKKSQLIIDLDGTSGYGTSFLEESFGGLIREDNLSLAMLDA